MTATPHPFRETGTGWFISPSGWMITNAHVVSPAHRPPAWLNDQLAERAIKSTCVPALLKRRGVRTGEQPEVEADTTRQALAQSLPTARVKLEPGIFVILSNGIRLSATVAKYSPPAAGEAMSGQDLALLKLEAADMPALTLGDSAALRIGDPIHILGFPGVVMSHELLNASAKVEASVTSGAVSGFKQDVADQPVVQTDAPAAWGNSGGPAVNSGGEVVGVLTFVSLSAGDEGGIVQGFNFVIPSAAVRQFLEGTAVNLGETSRFNAAWHGALRAYFGGDYPRAARNFAEANRLLPELPDVRRMTAETQDKIKNPPPKPFPWAMVTGLLLVAGLGTFGAIGGARWKRNRFRVKASEVARLLETSPEKPAILDVRDAATYAKSPVRIPDSIHVAPDELANDGVRLPIERERTVVAYCT